MTIKRCAPASALRGNRTVPKQRTTVDKPPPRLYSNLRGRLFHEKLPTKAQGEKDRQTDSDIERYRNRQGRSKRERDQEKERQRSIKRQRQRQRQTQILTCS